MWIDKTSCLAGLANLCQLSGAGNGTVRNSCNDLLERAPKSVTVCSSSKGGGGAGTRGVAVPFSAEWVVCGKGQGRGVN